MVDVKKTFGFGFRIELLNNFGGGIGWLGALEKIEEVGKLVDL